MIRFLDILCLFLLTSVYIIILAGMWFFASNYLDNKIIAILIPCYIIVWGFFIKVTHPFITGLWGEIKSDKL